MMEEVLDEQAKPGWWSVSPIDARRDERLSFGARILYIEINALASAEGYCWASNKYFADILKVSTRTVIGWVNQLIEYGYVFREIEYYSDLKTIKNRYLRTKDICCAISLGSEKKFTQCSEKTFTPPSEENCLDNNININNNNINNIYSPLVKNEVVKNKKENVVKHKYGHYKNVMLTDAELEKLKAEFPADWQQWIERVSEYVASTGKTYKSYLATIRNWARRDKQIKPKQKVSEQYGEIEIY